MVDLNATLIAQIINFLILLAILAKFAYKPIVKALEDRQAKIKADIDAAEQGKTAAEQLQKEYQAQLAQARTEAQKIVDKAMKIAQQNKDEILAEAKDEHARLLKNAREEIEREREYALAQLRNEVVVLSVAAASKIVRKNLDAETNKQLVDDFIAELDDRKIGECHVN